jgi:hypothetical protein
VASLREVPRSHHDVMPRGLARVIRASMTIAHGGPLRFRIASAPH